MNLLEVIKKNTKLYIILGFIILLGSIGVTYSLIVSNFKDIAINSTSLNIDANITYDTNSNGAEIVSNGNMLPISDNLVTGPDVTDIRVLKAKFNVSGVDGNPESTIYDIALHDVNIDCALRTKELKWRLYKGTTLLKEGNLSPTFDTMAGNRLVLTDTQEDLTPDTTSYTFLLWISEACTGNLEECDSSMDQSKYLNKQLSANIKIELSTKSKKTIKRITGSEDSCEYNAIAVPVCNNLTYNGFTQTLINDSTGYTSLNNTGKNAEMYGVTLKLDDGYKWSDGSTSDKVVSCNINKKDVTITTLGQTITYGNNIDSGVNNINYTTLANNDSIYEISLSSDIVEVGTGTINMNNVKIGDNYGNNVTDNYNIIKNNTGIVTINCNPSSEEPIVNEQGYTGEEKTGVTGGKYIDILGNVSGTDEGEYSITATPKKNYCWADNTTSTKEYTWSIIRNILNISLQDKEVIYTGNNVEIDNAVVTDKNGSIITDIPITYKYYNGNSCTGNPINTAPVNSGNYSVRAFTEQYEDYVPSESNCAKLNINRLNPTLEVSSSDLNIEYPNTGSFTYTYVGDGEVSCSSSNSNVATCSVNTSNKTVTVTSKSPGSATITLSAAKETNYNGASKTVSASVSSGTLSGSVTITGTNTYGQTLTADVTNTNSATLSYQWYYSSNNSTTGGTAISGATSSTYTIGSGLAGKYIYVVVTANKTNYGSTTWSDITDATTNTTAPVAKKAPTLTVSKSNLSINYPSEGSFTYTYDGDGTISCSLTSQSQGSATCSVDTVNKKVTLTPTKTGYIGVMIIASAGENYESTYKVVDVNINNGTLSGSVTITGTNTYGQTLTASVTNTNSATLSYQWYYSSSNSTSGGTAISGATSSTYTIGSDLVGKYIYVVVGASKTNYTSTTWSDITDATANTAATVARKAPTLTVSKTSLSIKYPNTGSFTYTYDGDGTISCSSSNTSAATCSVNTSTKTVTVTSVADGTSTITLSAAQGTNYNGASKTVSTTVSYTTYTITLNNQSATTAGTTTLYGRYSDGIYLDSSYSQKMTTGANSIVVPKKTGHTFGGYYTSTGGSGTQLINASGYIKNSFTNTLYSSNVTLYAKWTLNSYTLTINSGTGGSVKVENTTRSTSATASSGGSTTLTVYYGDTVKVTATAGEGYSLYTLKHGSTSMTSGSSYTVTGAETISATWDDIPSAPVLTTIYDIWGSRSYTATNYQSDAGVSGEWTSSTGDPQISFTGITEFTGISGAYVELESALDKDLNIQIFYATSSGSFSSTYRTVSTLPQGTTKLMIPFTHGSQSIWTKFRFDIGNEQGLKYKIKYLGIVADANQWNRDYIILHGTTTENVSGINNWQYTFNANATSSGAPATGWSTFSDSASTSFITPAYTGNRNAYTYVRACDKSGNCSAKSSTYIKTDLSIPTATITATNATTVNLSYSDNFGVTGYYWGTDNPSNTSVTYTSVTSATSGSLTKTVSSAGKYYFVVKDASGRTSSVKSINAYTVSYNANGGSGAPSSQIKLHGGDLTLSSTKPSRTNYTFLGWSTSSTATNFTYEAGEPYTSNASTTLYAVWKQNYTVKYYANLNYMNTNKGIIVTLGGRHFYKNNAEGTLCGYIYDGNYTGPLLIGTTTESVKYYTSVNSTVFSYIGSITYNGIKYYVSSNEYWMAGNLTDTSGLGRTKNDMSSMSSAEKYEIIQTAAVELLSANTSTKSQSIPYSVSTALSSNTFTRSGYTFAGWSTTPTGSVVYTNGQTVTDLGNIDLYAVWNKN